MSKLMIAFAIVAILSIRVAAAETAPNWTKTIRMTDGRTFVSDGAITIDAALAKPSELPKTELPEATAKLIERYMALSSADEVNLAGLSAGERPNTYRAPSGLVLNAKYVSFLRQVVPQAKLRMKGDLDPVVILSGGTAVGVVMPMKR